VEGGAQILQAFLDAGLWDEARVVSNDHLLLPGGLPAPQMPHAQLVRMEKWGTDTIKYYVRS